MGADMVGSEVLHRVKRTEVDALRDFLASLNLERRLGLAEVHRSDRLPFMGSYFEPEPRLTTFIVKIDIASSQIGNGERGNDRFVGDVLETLQLQLNLKLRL